MTRPPVPRADSDPELTAALADVRRSLAENGWAKLSVFHGDTTFTRSETESRGTRA